LTTSRCSVINVFMGQDPESQAGRDFRWPTVDMFDGIRLTKKPNEFSYAQIKES